MDFSAYKVELHSIHFSQFLSVLCFPACRVRLLIFRTSVIAATVFSQPLCQQFQSRKRTSFELAWWHRCYYRSNTKIIVWTCEIKCTSEVSVTYKYRYVARNIGYYSLSVLLYAAPALTLQCEQIDELNACWNNVFRKIVWLQTW